MLIPQPPALVDERDVMSLALEAISIARELEADPFNFTRNCVLKRSIREAESNWRCLRILERELQFAPHDDFHELLREAVRAALIYIDGIGTPHCPMAYVTRIERELWEAAA